MHVVEQPVEPPQVRGAGRGDGDDVAAVVSRVGAAPHVPAGDQLIARITTARKIGARQVETAISELAEAGLVLDQPRVALTEVGQARHGLIRAALDDVTARLFGGFPPEDLATAGRVLSIITARADAELAGPGLS